MERIVIPGRATYSPVALSDLIVGAPMATRLLLGATVPGQVVAAGALGYYVGSAARDWYARRGVRPVDFQAAFGVDVDTLQPMPEGMRRAECRELAEVLSDDFTVARRPREETAKEVNRLLERYIAQITGQEIVTSSEVRSFTLTRVLFPFALGTCDAISGDVAIFQDMDVLEPHVIAHEFAHRKGYLKELHAQVLAFFALRTSGDPELVQSARVERLQRNLAVLADSDAAAFHREVDALPLRPALARWFHGLRPMEAADPGPVATAMRKLYDQRMKLTGQNGISDYDRGFTDFLWTFRNSDTATQPRVHAAI
ncbi:MAG: DUF3810 family protein [Alphaproteobacteria bacterium]|nr:DUF3810 family protein [Alphaproteobacteria bacterium]